MKELHICWIFEVEGTGSPNGIGLRLTYSSKEGETEFNLSFFGDMIGAECSEYKHV